MTLFVCHDRWKRHVTLDEHWWNVHVRSRRPWMDDYIGVVKSTINRPDSVYRDADYADRVVYYSHGRLHDSPDEYMKVVVEYDSEDEGSVVTAFITLDTPPKDGETKLWP